MTFSRSRRRTLAYARYTLRRPQWRARIRVFSGFHAVHPDTFKEIVAQAERFVTFFPLQAAIDQSIFKIVAHESVPETARKLPLFRAPGHVDRDGFVHDWWLWDGEKEWKVGKLSQEQKTLPIREVWNDTLLIERIEENWTPATEPLREPSTLRKLFRA